MVRASFQRIRWHIAEDHLMHEIEIANYARRLFAEHGAKAIAIAAQRLRSATDKHDDQDAETWRRIEIALKEMRGPRET
jgi:hypothetical protein